MNFVYTDEEFFELVRPVESYLGVAGLVETRVGPRLDPFILTGIAKTNFDAVKAPQQGESFTGRSVDDGSNRRIRKADK